MSGAAVKVVLISLLLITGAGAADKSGCSATDGSCVDEQAEVDAMKVAMLQRRSMEEDVAVQWDELQANWTSQEEFAHEVDNHSLLEQSLSRKGGGGGGGGGSGGGGESEAWNPLDPSLNLPSNGPTLTFYAYRVQNDQNYAPYNQNLASLGGALWYLQNEITIRLDNCHRRFQKTRLQRMKITYKPTRALLNAGMNFGVRVAFDYGKNTGDGCTNGKYRSKYHGNKMYNKYGYVVGCNKLGDPGGCNYPVCPCGHNDRGCHAEGYCTPGMSGPEAITYPGAAWYSFPGECPQQDLKEKSSWCKSKSKGGACATPDGRGDCTYRIDFMGEIDLDELSGVKPKYRSFKEFCDKGCREYTRNDGMDGGTCGITFYDGRHDLNKAKERMRKVDDMFKAKYPQLPRDSDIPAVACDFNSNKFFQGNWG